MRRANKNQFLEHQTREFHDSAGRRWRVRIEQGGGRSGDDGGPPIAQLIFTPADDEQADEIATTGDADNWDLSSCTDERLSSLLVQAQAHASYPRSE
jgi:hypothetical protein